VAVLRAHRLARLGPVADPDEAVVELERWAVQAGEELRDRVLGVLLLRREVEDRGDGG